ncbi:MAG: MFS transporter [Beijerinckiaceae bacterium]
MNQREDRISWRIQAPVYGAGMFASTVTDVISIILPVWLAGTGKSAATIGLIIGSKHLLPILLAIHGGALMDRFGARSVMVGCLLLAVVTLPLFPWVGWIPFIVVLQMISGFGSSMGWLGSQTLFGQIMRRDHVYAGRFAFALRVGGFIGPPIAGLVWDNLGVGSGFLFLGLWALGAVIMALLVPRDAISAPERAQKARIADMLPRWSDYRAAFRLATIPAMTVVLMITVVRIAASSVQDSFYPLYLTTVGYSATQIGLLMTISAATAAASSLTIGWITRFAQPMWVLIISAAWSVIFVSITPLMPSFTALAISAALRGLSMGVSQPLMMSMLIGAAGKGSQGKGAALRTTANRVAAAVTPISMGAVAGLAGLGESFFVIGGVLLAALVVIAIYVWRRPDLAREA